LVDDDDTIRDSVKVSLEAQDMVNVKVLDANNVDAGIVLAQRTKPNVIILDLHMPEKTGYDFMDEINADKSLKDTQFIMLTGDDSMANLFKAESKSIKPYRFIGKHFEVSDLQAMVFEAAGLLTASD
jgi:CheY-like chemotaxis protein